MIAKLIKPVIAARQDIPSVVETLAAGTTVDFDPTDGVTKVVCDGKAYLVIVSDLLEAAHPTAWEES